MTIRKGDHLFVDSNATSNGCYGFVTDIIENESVANNYYNVFFPVEQRTEKEVNSGRVSPSNIAAITGTSRTCSGLCAQSHIELPPPAKTTQQTPLSFSNILQQSFNYCHKRNKQHPLYQYLNAGKDKESGWLLREERLSKAASENREAEEMKQKTSEEKNLIAMQVAIFAGLPKDVGKDAMQCIHHAWNISCKTCNNIVKNLINNRGSAAQKVRTDKGNSIFNCEKRRKEVFKHAR